MAFQAIGRGVKRTKGGLEVKVEIMDDQTGKTLKFETYEGASLVIVQQRVKADLDQLVTNEHDAALSAAVVGVLLATSQPADDVKAIVAQTTDAPVATQTVETGGKTP